jgi:thiol-disulfide isomerase/thioredoxin
MKTIARTTLSGLLLSLGLFSMFTPGLADAARKEVCLVCKVKEGANEPEVAKAFRTHEGKEYGFCSEKCAQAFEAEPAAYVPAEYPKPAPAFDLKDLKGNPITLASLKGKPVLLDFWATWCAPCRKSMPELQELHKKYAARGFTVVGVAIDEGPSARSKVAKYIAAKKYTYAIALDDGKHPAWEAFRVKAVPAAFLIDAKGQVVAQWLGAPANTGELEAKIEGLLPKLD